MPERIITDPLEIQHAYTILQRFFLIKPPYNASFNPDTDHKLLIYPYFNTFSSNPPFEKAWIETAQALGDKGVYLDTLNSKSQKMLWFIDFVSLSDSSLIRLPLLQTIFSPLGHWAIFETPEEYALLAATDKYMQLMLTTYPEIKDGIHLFLHYLIDTAYINFKPKALYNFLINIYPQKYINYLFVQHQIPLDDV